MEKRTLERKLENIVKNPERARRVLNRAARHVKLTNQDLRSYIHENGECKDTYSTVGLAQSLLYMKGEDVTDFKGYYAGAFITVTDDKRYTFSGIRAGEGILFKGEDSGKEAIFSDQGSGSYSVFKGKDAGVRAQFKGSFSGQETSFDGDDAGKGTLFQGKHSGIKASFKGVKSGNEAVFRGEGSGERVLFEGEGAGQGAYFKGYGAGRNSLFKGEGAGKNTNFEGAGAGCNRSFEGDNAGESSRNINNTKDLRGWDGTDEDMKRIERDRQFHELAGMAQSIAFDL